MFTQIRFSDIIKFKMNMGLGNIEKGLKLIDALSSSLIMLLFLLISISSYSQYYLSTEWVKRFGGTFNETPTLIKSFENGDYIAVGTFKEMTDLSTDPEVEYILNDGVGWAETNIDFVARFDANGSITWAHVFPAMDIKDFSISLENDIVLVAHYSSSLDADPGEGEFIIAGSGNGTICTAIIKLDEDGNFQWASYGQSHHLDGGITAHCIETDEVGNVYLAGKIERFTKFFSSDSSNFTFDLVHDKTSAHYLMKLDVNGMIDWWELIDGYHLNFKDIVLDYPHRVILGGRANNSFWMDPHGVDELISVSSGIAPSPFLASFSLDGDYERTKLFEVFTDFVDMEIDASKNFYLALNFEGYIDADPGPEVDNMYSLIDDKGAVIKLNSTWDYLWGNEYAAVVDIELDDAQDVVLLGRHFVDPLYTDEFNSLSGINSHGEDLYVDTLQGHGYRDFALGSDNTLLIFGYFSSEQTFETEVGTTTLTSEGEYDFYFTKKRYDGFLSTDNVIENKTDVVIYPNPTKDHVLIQSVQPIQNVKLYDMGGNCLLNQTATELSLRGLNNGVYIVRITTDTKVLSRKIVKK